MDKDTYQDHHHNPSLLHSTTTTTTTPKDDSPRKSPTVVGGGGGVGGGSSSDRLKRDEWSEGAVSTLLEAYEAKWILRNRAKLKGHDWEDVARSVSSRANCTKSPKTQTQCKNKIESMKKRYRSESAAIDGSSWPLYPRLDMLLRGSAVTQLPPPPPQPQPSPLAQSVPPPPPLQVSTGPHLMLLEPPPPPLLHPTVALPPPLPPPHPVLLPPGVAQNSHGSNGIDRLAKEDGVGPKLSDQVSDKNPPETDSSTPALYSEKSNHKSKKPKAKAMKNKKKMKKSGEEWEIAESIRWLAEAIVRSEQSRMETMKELEKMRIEAEARRGEMDLKRTEIIATTQLEIARIFAGGTGKGAGIDSSLRIGRN